MKAGALPWIHVKSKRSTSMPKSKPRAALLHYNAMLPHGALRRSSPKPGQSIGRLQTFGITTNFIEPLGKAMICSIRISVKTFVKHKVSQAKWQLKTKAGPLTVLHISTADNAGGSGRSAAQNTYGLAKTRGSLSDAGVAKGHDGSGCGTYQLRRAAACGPTGR